MFQLTAHEKSELVANCDQLNKLKYSPSLPHAFTEHGAIMAANVLNSRRAIAVSVFIVRAFIRLREELSTGKVLALKLTELERKVADHDHTLLALVQAIKKLAEPAKPKKLDIGFKQKKKTIRTTDYTDYAKYRQKTRRQIAQYYVREK
jgi:hypothetical protein